MGIKYGRGWGGARISLSRGSVLSREYFPSSLFYILFTYLGGAYAPTQPFAYGPAWGTELLNKLYNNTVM